MDQLKEPSDLLLESDIISKDEKQEILDKINEGFLSRHEDMYDLGQLSAKSSGLTLPFSIAAISMICTLLILLFSRNLIVQNNEAFSINEFTNISGSEWEILKIYMEESTIKLESKNSEIGEYKEEIVSYDRRLTTLRELLNVKKDTETRLAAEREKLKIEGIAEEEIASKITELEETIVSELAPGMITFYNLSIDDLNKQIEEVLNDKTESEAKLKTSIVEREVLVTENEKIQEEVKVKEAAIPLVPEVIATMNKMNEIVDQYEYENVVRNQISDLYLKIFQDLDDNEYTAALERIEELENLLANSSSTGEYKAIDQLLIQIKIVDILKGYVNKSRIKADAVLFEKSEYEKITNKQEVLTANGSQDNSYQNDQSLETDTVSQPVYDENNDPGELLLYGVISLIQFDRIIIESISGFSVQPGIEFYIINRKDQAEKLGVGIITDVSEGAISGRLELLLISSSQPQADDLIYIKADTNG